jgi:hypothetical protein
MVRKNVVRSAAPFTHLLLLPARLDTQQIAEDHRGQIQIFDVLLVQLAQVLDSAHSLGVKNGQVLLHLLLAVVLLLGDGTQHHLRVIQNRVSKSKRSVRASEPQSVRASERQSVRASERQSVRASERREAVR